MNNICRTLRNILIVTITAALLGCVSVAKIEELPENADSINYSGLEKEEYGYYEHTFKLNNVSPEQFYAATEIALTSNGFKIVNADKMDRKILAKRGLRANEWGSVAGVYFQSEKNRITSKVIVKISQDFTGTFHQSYAENISIRIKNILNKN